MNIKRVKIKDFLVRIKLKKKTRGRPSKWEYQASAVMSKVLLDNQNEIHKAMEDMLIYGTGIIKVKP